ncbi:MAG: zinc ribbon domain-containing protein [Cyanobacteria bacterium Co-bin8]|nr:zinc ribbon domain-containing protein [Cyanobacteria bacterium Co-bin8]
MAYACQIGPGQWIYLDSLGAETVITVAASSAGQQQQSTSRLLTGTWTAAPIVVQVGAGVAIKLTTAEGSRYLQVQGSQIAEVAGVPTFDQGSVLPLQENSEMPQAPLQPIQPIQPMQPMQPLPPLQMGNMQMSLNPMAMQMGNMAMQMGNNAAGTQQRFCTQCGQLLKPEDRFCGQCGHAVSQSG